MNSSSEERGMIDVRDFEFPVLLKSHDIESSEKPAAGNAISEKLKSEYARGVRDGAANSEAHIRTEVQKERQRAGELLQCFEQEKAQYFRDVEREVVRLSCAIARKVLHREAQVDPQLLLALVRAALVDVAAATRIQIFVNPAHRTAWAEYFPSNSNVQVEIIADESLSKIQSRIVTDLGSTTIGWEEHLAEIERGLFDLLDKNPGRVQ